MAWGRDNGAGTTPATQGKAEHVAREVNRLEAEGFIGSTPPGNLRGNAPRDRMTIAQLAESLYAELQGCHQALAQLEVAIGPVLESVPEKPINTGAGDDHNPVPMIGLMLVLLRNARELQARLISIGQRVAL